MKSSLLAVDDAECDPTYIDELLPLDMYNLMTDITRYNSDNQHIFGYLPMMCRGSVCQLGALNAQSFVERVNSRGKLIVGTKRTAMSKHELIDKLVVLKINREFMIYCRERSILDRVQLEGVEENVEEVLELVYEEDEIYS